MLNANTIEIQVLGYKFWVKYRSTLRSEIRCMKCEKETTIHCNLKLGS